jgi:hypothetical protein
MPKLKYGPINKATDTEGGDFIHTEDACTEGRIKQIISNKGQVIYECQNCGHKWLGDKLTPVLEDLEDKLELFK